MRRSLPAFALAAALLAAGCGLLKARPPEPAIPVRMVPEMERIAGFDGGRPCKPGEFADEVAKALADWAAKRPTIEPLVTAAKARELSRWAIKQMQAYRRVPPLERVAFAPKAWHEGTRRLVFEGTVDTLPTHHRLVTRWLKLYLLYDLDKQAVVEAAVTIRGQLLE